MHEEETVGVDHDVDVVLAGELYRDSGGELHVL